MTTALRISTSERETLQRVPSEWASYDAFLPLGQWRCHLARLRLLRERGLVEYQVPPKRHTLGHWRRLVYWW